MSFFKQAQDAIKFSYSTRQDTSSSSSLSTPKNSYINDNRYTKYEKDQLKAQEMIQNTPTSGQGYLLSVLLYQEQNNLLAAIKVCLQGLESISSEKYPYHYTQLQKEKEKMLEKQAKCSQNGFFHLLPYPVLCVIFDKVGYRDLLRCINVCRQWFDFIMVEYPCFWNKLMPETLPTEHKSNMDALVRHETHEYRLTAGDPKDYGMLQNIFVLLPMLRNSHSVQKLYFSYPIHWYADDLRLLGTVIQCLSFTLREIEFICCTMDDAELFNYITDACAPSLTYVSISLTKQQDNIKCHVRNKGSTCSNKIEKHIILRCIPRETAQQNINSSEPFPNRKRYYPSATYLKSSNYLTNISEEPPKQTIFNLGASDHIAYHRAEETLQLNLFPNLVHLFLGWVESYNHNFNPFYQETIKSCPLLENLIVTFSGSMPHTTISNIDQTEFDNSTITTLMPITTAKAKVPLKGLRRFVLTDCNRSQEQKNVIPIFKKHHATLELLYLDYDNMGMGPIALHKLGSLGCPQLREFRLSSVSRMLRKPILDKSKRSWKTTGPLLVQLFSSCPALEVIELNEQSPINSELHLEINASVLATIAQKCPQLTHFSFNSDNVRIHLGHGGYACKNFLCFIKNTNCPTTEGKGSLSAKRQLNTNKSRLECLKVPEMDSATAHILVQNLQSLKHLHIFKWHHYNTTSTSSADNVTLVDNTETMAPVRQILESRGGSLVLG